MKIAVNNERKELALSSITLEALLKECRVAMPETVSVQVNGEFVDRADYPSREIKEGDSVDFLYFMGGGSFQ